MSTWNATFWKHLKLIGIDILIKFAKQSKAS